MHVGLIEGMKHSTRRAFRVVAVAGATNTVEAGRSVAEWCMAAGREQATIAISSATNLPTALRDFWGAAQSVSHEGGEPGRQHVLAFPSWDECTGDWRLFQEVLHHIQDCAEVCEYVGETLMVSGRHPSSQSSEDEPQRPPCTMLLLRSFSRPHLTNFTDEYGMDDPFASLPDDDVNTEHFCIDGTPADEAVVAATRAWVEGIICQVKVCPFSATADRAGLPQGGVTYPLTHARIGEEMYEAFWKQVLELQAADERTLSTVLLVAPRFATYSPDGFDAFADTLNTALARLRVEDYIQLVFFHPKYTFRDGQDRLGGEEDADSTAANLGLQPAII